MGFARPGPASLGLNCYFRKTYRRNLPHASRAAGAPSAAAAYHMLLLCLSYDPERRGRRTRLFRAWGQVFFRRRGAEKRSSAKPPFLWAVAFRSSSLSSFFFGLTRGLGYLFRK